jgi:hypothetical protein
LHRDESMLSGVQSLVLEAVASGLVVGTTEALEALASRSLLAQQVDLRTLRGHLGWAVRDLFSQGLLATSYLPPPAPPQTKVCH